MLVLSRKAGEKIFVRVGEVVVEIVVADVSGGRCRIGVTAPRDCPVWRCDSPKREEEQMKVGG
jgi:carbon storage regulator CsrA